MKRALILDLDNTIYAVQSIGDKLFAPMFKLLDESDLSEEKLKSVKQDIMRIPFQKVADKYGFSEDLTKKCIALLNDQTYDSEIEPFDDYQTIKEYEADKFLVTTGFKKLQESKIRNMGIAGDFKEIFIVDPETSSKTKKDIFVEIMEKYGYKAEEILIIGDDSESEIKAGKELGTETFLLDPENHHPANAATYKGRSLKDLPGINKK